MPDNRHYAIEWVQRGYYPIPIPYREKGPKLADWQNLRLTAEQVPAYFNGIPMNCGVLLGEPNGACDIDLDSMEAVAAWPHFAPETGLVFGRKSKPRSHWFYRVDPPLPSRRYLDPVNGITLLEFRCLKSDGSAGLQTVVPPSIHPSGEIVEFARGLDGLPANVDSSELGAAVLRTAAVALLARHWPAPGGGRHDAFLALAGALAYARWGLADATRLVSTLYRLLWPGNTDLGAAAKDVESTFQRHDDGQDVTGLPHLEKFCSRQVVLQVAKWLGLGTEPAKKKAQPLADLTRLPSIWQLQGETRWLIEGLFSEGSVNMITGDSGDGKSTLALALAGAVAHGSTFLGRACAQRQVLYCDRENPLFTIKERLERLKIRETANLHYWGGWVDPAPEGPGSLSILAFVKEHQPLIVFDSLIAYHEGSEQDATETRKHMGLYRVLAANGATVLILHHTGKSETSKDYRGSSDIKAAIDLGYLLERTDGSTPGSELAGMRLVPFKSRLYAVLPIRLDYSDGTFAPSDPGANPRTESEIMLDAVRLNPGGTKLDLATYGRKHGLGRNQAEQTLDDLVLAGKVLIRRGSKKAYRYYLPDAGPTLVV